MPNLPEGTGRLLSISIPDFATPGDLGSIFAMHMRLRVNGVRFTFTTDATVATRHVTFYIQSIQYRSPTVIANVTQTAGLTRQYDFAIGNPATPVLVSSLLACNLPHHIYAEGSMAFYTTTLNIQAGDAFTLVYLDGEQWIEP